MVIPARPSTARVPEPRFAVLASGEDLLAVGAECHGPDGRLVDHRHPSRFPVATSQSRAVPSSLPVKAVRPSGLNATDVTAS